MPVDPRAVLRRPTPSADVLLRYGKHRDQVADLRLPSSQHDELSRPLVIVVHGGFWRAEWDRSHTGPLAADLAARGYPVAQLEFRRTGQPGGGWPGTFDDVEAGITALPALVAGAMAQPDRATDPPVLLGHSAGGQLALWYATQARSRLRGVVALAPVADLGRAYDLDLDDGAVAALLGGAPAAVPDRYAAVDPVLLAALAAPRTVVIHGALDQQVPLDLSRRYVAAAQEAGGDVTLVEVPDAEHFGLIDPRSPVWDRVTAALRAVCEGR